MNKVSRGGFGHTRSVNQGLGPRKQGHHQDTCRPWPTTAGRRPGWLAGRLLAVTGAGPRFLLLPAMAICGLLVVTVGLAQPGGGKNPQWVGIIAPAQAVDVSASLSGRLQAVQAEVGDHVSQGQLLATVDATLLEEELNIARATLDSVRAELHSAQTQLQHKLSRARRLDRAALAVAQEERDNAQAEVAMAASAQDAAAARVAEKSAEIDRLQRALQRAEVRAPFAGIISVRYLEAGTQVNENSRIFSLMAPQQLVVRFAVPSDDSTHLAVGMPVMVTMGAQNETLRAQVSWVAPAVDVASQMIFAEALVQNAGAHLRAGLEAWVAPLDRRVARQQ